MYRFNLDEFLRDLATVVNIDTGNHHEAGINSVFNFFAEKYKALGLAVEIKCMDGHTEAPFMTVRNSNSEKIDVLFLAHADTVFEVGTAEKRPFSIDEEGHGRGPGCIDDKGGCVALYHLIREMVENGECNFNFCVAMNSDEETKSTYSKAFIEELAGISDKCIVMEPGRPQQEYVDTRKGGYNYLIKCHGIAAHSGADPEKGASAVLELSKWVTEIYKFFNLEEGTTVNVGRFDGGADNGQVPDYAEITLSMRALLPEVAEKINARLYELAEHPFDPRCKVEVLTVSRRPAMFPHEKTQKMLKVFKSVCDELDFPFVCLTTGGGSDGNFVSYHGVATIDGCGPAGGKLHTADEFLIIETVGKRIEVLRRFLLKEYPVEG